MATPLSDYRNHRLTPPPFHKKSFGDLLKRLWTWILTSKPFYFKHFARVTTPSKFKTPLQILKARSIHACNQTPYTNISISLPLPLASYYVICERSFTLTQPSIYQTAFYSPKRVIPGKQFPLNPFKILGTMLRCTLCLELVPYDNFWSTYLKISIYDFLLVKIIQR